MKKFRFKVPLYEFTVTLLQVERPSDADKVAKELRNVKVREADMQEDLDCIRKDCRNGGDTWRNNQLYQIVVVFFRFTTERKRENVWSHEKRHIEDRIMEYTRVDDIESAGLLAGFLGEQFYKFRKLVGTGGLV